MSSPSSGTEPPSSLYRAAPRSGRSSPRKGLLPTSIEQPRAAGDPYKKEPPPSLERAVPRSGSSRPRNSLILAPSNGQPRAAGALLETVASSLPQSSIRAAPRNGSSPRKTERAPPSLYTEQPRAAGAPLGSVSSLPQSSSPAQREIPNKEPPHPFL